MQGIDRLFSLTSADAEIGLPDISVVYGIRVNTTKRASIKWFWLKAFRGVANVIQYLHCIF